MHFFVPYYPFGYYTKEETMSHNEHCPVEATLELIGGKYKTLILWHLADGKLRFSQLRREITGITPKMLTQQLRELEAHSLIHREVFPIVPPKVEYSLTELGKSLMPLLVAMRDWGSSYLRDHALEPNCFMMSNTPATESN
jgi:DNA-binding HxlR family transcriptional regulator